MPVLEPRPVILLSIANVPDVKNTNSGDHNMKFDTDTQVRILTQVALHCPRKLLESTDVVAWKKNMALPLHIKNGIECEKLYYSGDDGRDTVIKINLSFLGTQFGFIRYKETGIYDGVFRCIPGRK